MSVSGLDPQEFDLTDLRRAWYRKDPAIQKTARSNSFTTVVAKHYDGVAKILQQSLWNTLFPWGNSQEISPQSVNDYGDSKLLRRRRGFKRPSWNINNFLRLEITLKRFLGYKIGNNHSKKTNLECNDFVPNGIFGGVLKRTSWNKNNFLRLRKPHKILGVQGL